MGDVRILKDQLELGLPLESAALLAGYDFEEIDGLKDDEEIIKVTKIAEASLMRKHLTNVKDFSEVNPRMSTWLLERRFPQHFSQTSKIVDLDEVPKSVTLRGVAPDADGDN